MDRETKVALRDMKNGVLNPNSEQGRMLLQRALRDDPVTAIQQMSFIPQDQVVRTMREVGYSAGEIAQLAISDPRERAKFLASQEGAAAALRHDPTNSYARLEAQKGATSERNIRAANEATARRQQQAREQEEHRKMADEADISLGAMVIAQTLEVINGDDRRAKMEDVANLLGLKGDEREAYMTDETRDPDQDKARIDELRQQSMSTNLPPERRQLYILAAMRADDSWPKIERDDPFAAAHQSHLDPYADIHSGPRPKWA